MDTQLRLKHGTQPRNSAREHRSRRGVPDDCALTAVSEIHRYDQATRSSRLQRSFPAIDEGEVARPRRLQPRDSRDVHFTIALELYTQPLCQFSDAHAL